MDIRKQVAKNIVYIVARVIKPFSKILQLLCHQRNTGKFQSRMSIWGRATVDDFIHRCVASMTPWMRNMIGISVSLLFRICHVRWRIWRGWRVEFQVNPIAGWLNEGRLCHRSPRGWQVRKVVHNPSRRCRTRRVTWLWRISLMMKFES